MTERPITSPDDPVPEPCKLHGYGFYAGCNWCTTQIPLIVRWLLRQHGVPATQIHPLRGESK